MQDRRLSSGRLCMSHDGANPRAAQTFPHVRPCSSESPKSSRHTDVPRNSPIMLKNIEHMDGPMCQLPQNLREQLLAHILKGHNADFANWSWESSSNLPYARREFRLEKTGQKFDISRFYYGRKKCQIIIAHLPVAGTDAPESCVLVRRDKVWTPVEEDGTSYSRVLCRVEGQPC